jgi:hypothetical protein
MDFPTHPIGWKPQTMEEKKKRDETQKRNRERNQLHVPLTNIEKQWMFVRCVAETGGLHMKK